MFQYQLMRTLFPRLPQVHPMKRKNRTEKKCQKQLQEVQPESEQKHLMRKSKNKCRQKSLLTYMNALISRSELFRLLCVFLPIAEP